MERALEGVSAAPGIASGAAVVLEPQSQHTDKRIPTDRRDTELGRANEALRAAVADLEEISAGLRRMGHTDDAEIIDTGVLIAKDPSLTARIESLVMESGMPADHALRQAAGECAELLGRLEDPVLAQRADDVRSLGRRAAAHATGAHLVPGGILVATDLGPADVADLGLAASGVALAEGGVTAHAAIVARSLGVPMVVGLGRQLLEVASGDELVIDGDHGVVVRNPTSMRVADAQAHAQERRHAREEARRRRDEPALTADGHPVTVLTNAASVREAIEGLEQGAEGIGLLRTELSFLDAHAWPTLERQTEFLKPILARLGGRPATVRLFDFGGDKTPPFLRGTTERGIDLLLSFPDKFRAHIRAILAAAGDGQLRILVPMVTSPQQMRLVRGVLGENTALLGAMIETPEAAEAAEAIAAHSDFLSIGTNDLTQLVLGLDRERSKTAPVTDARVLGLIAATVHAAHSAGIKVDVCGEAASDPKAMPVLVGLGVDELSVAAARVGQVRHWVRELTFADAESEAAALLHQRGHASRERV